MEYFISSQQYVPSVLLAQSVECAETKIVFSIASYLKSILVYDVKDKPFSVLFDESLNKHVIKKQLDVLKKILVYF